MKKLFLMTVLFYSISNHVLLANPKDPKPLNLSLDEKELIEKMRKEKISVKSVCSFVEEEKRKNERRRLRSSSFDSEWLLVFSLGGL